MSGAGIHFHSHNKQENRILKFYFRRQNKFIKVKVFVKGHTVSDYSSNLTNFRVISPHTHLFNRGSFFHKYSSRIC